MKWSWEEIVALFERQGYCHLKGSKHGLEKECLRVDEKGLLAKTPHPRSLGSPLTHPYIKTDFCEAQLELITPAFLSEEGALRFLHHLHAFTYQKLENEWLWPFSVPCKLPRESQIPLARYGTSNRGVEKYIYRQGLSARYGRKMQTLSGVHYNFSFSEEFWLFLQTHFGKKEELKSFISESYLHMARNFLRLSWLNTYLFGATPAADCSFFNAIKKPLKLMNRSTVYGPSATSLRMSRYGYQSKLRGLSYNSLPEYLDDLSYAVSTPYPPYAKLGTQLNDHILQMESEFYSLIRPKPNLQQQERTLLALGSEGIAYIEVRSVDLNPYSEIGVSLDQLYFLHLFLIYCLFEPSPVLDSAEQKSNAQKQNKVALYGQKLNAQLKAESLAIFAKLQQIAELLDCAYGSDKYRFSLAKQREKLFDPKQLLSAQILADAGKAPFIALGCHLAAQYKRACLKEPLVQGFVEKMERLALQSIEDQVTEEMVDDRNLKGYEALETSTQALIREACLRGIEVEVLDWNDNLIRLQRGKKVEYVKQATRTGKDSLISYHLMENKHVTKHILQEFGLPVPAGFLFSEREQAIDAYSGLSKKHLVVKPNATNYGIAVSFIPPRDGEAYRLGVEEAFKYGDLVIVEEFCPGSEYRFLVVGERVAAVCQRVPANVVGDGTHSIAQLVRLKNHNPRYFRKFSPLKIGKVEREFLHRQGLDPEVVLKKGEQIFLRQNSNVSTGGESIDFTDKAHEVYCTAAIQAAKSVNAAICGVDMIVKNIEEEGEFFILELNFNPALYLHRYPVEGKTRFVEKDILDFLGF